MPERVQNLLDSLLDRQRQRWLEGERPAVEELLDGSALRHDSEAQLDLVYNEVVVREELGEHPSAEEYIRRYPHLQEDLRLQFEVHHAVHDGILLATTPVPDVQPVSLLHTAAPEPRTAVQDYELIEQLGQGGMGVVYKARHRRLRRFVALKTFRPDRLPTPRERSRFQTEAEAIARLQHPNIVQIFEIGQWNGAPCLALELVEGGTLSQKLRDFAFAPRAAAELVETLARAVQHAHDQHIIHRDLKPANVLFTREGSPKITDFGLAKVLVEDPSLRDVTRTGEPIGTPRYMAPEQASGQHDRIGPATDVHALGSMLYECLTGQAPFMASSMIDTLEKIRSEEPLPPRRLQASVPRDLETICLACLRKEPSKRYASAQALANDLRRFLNGEPIHARPTPGWERAWKWCRRNPTRATLAAVAALLVCAVVTATVVLSHLELRRIDSVRREVIELVRDGQEALLRQDADTAHARFQAALVKVQGEPSLRDHETGIAGWLDHCRRAANQQHWKQRVPPREFDERRDEAILLSLLLDPQQPDAVRVARQAIEAALELTLPDDPAWRQEREQLVLLDAELVLREAGLAAALTRLDEEFVSRLFHERKAAYLDQLGHKEDADRQRTQAGRFPPDEIRSLFLSATDRLRRRDFRAATHDFETILCAEPAHFLARLFQAICFLQENRPGEARVALTACVAQRPRFAWSYLIRSQAFSASGDSGAAIEDVQRGLNANPSDQARVALLARQKALRLQLQQPAANKVPAKGL